MGLSTNQSLTSSEFMFLGNDPRLAMEKLGRLNVKEWGEVLKKM
jgi:hypothetical protein